MITCILTDIDQDQREIVRFKTPAVPQVGELVKLGDALWCVSAHKMWELEEYTTAIGQRHFPTVFLTCRRIG